MEIKYIVLSFLAFTISLKSNSQTNDKRVKPNIVFIYLDDLGYGDLSCYGATEIKTPNIDALANGGVRFTNGYATSATCTPSRYGLLTGVYPWRNKDAKILPGSAPLLIGKEQLTIPKMLKEKGYQTAVVGKWHLGLGTGIASVYFSKIYFKITNFFKRIKKPVHKLILGGFLIGLMLYLIPPLYGEGYGLINNLLNGNSVEALKDLPYNIDFSNVWMVIILLLIIAFFKAIAMTTTFAAGGVGGIFIPTLFMGSALGNAFAKIINALGGRVSESNFTLIGMTGLMAGVLHAPLTAIFLIAEITGGYELFVPLMLVAAISFAFTKYFVANSIYTVELAKRGELITHDKDKNVLMLMQIDKLIETNFKALHPEMLLGKMLKKAVANSTRNIFPVIDKNEEFLGIVLLDDIRPIMFDSEMYDKVDVQTIMKAAPEIIFYNDSVETVMQKFKESDAWNLPVVKDKKYIGFISKSKLLTAYRNKLIEVTSS